MAGTAKEPRDLSYSLRQNVDLLPAVVDVETGAAGRHTAQPSHERLRAVMPGSDRYAIAVEDGAHVMRMQITQVESDDATASGRIASARRSPGPVFSPRRRGHSLLDRPHVPAPPPCQDRADSR